MKFKVAIYTSLGTFYRYLETDITQGEILEDFKKLTSMNYVSMEKDEWNNTSLIFYDKIWENAIIQIEEVE